MPQPPVSKGIKRSDKKPAAAARQRYHHGDLREALLAAAERVLERDGLEKFTLRACAREAGVSHAAPAHHFGDLAGMTSVLAVRAFERLSAFMDRYAAEAAPDPRAMLPAMGVAYIDFALRHPGMYRLMFRIEANRTGDAVLQQAAADCHGRLTNSVRAVLAEQRAAPPDEARVREASALAWSVVHGFSSLALDGLFDADCPSVPGAGRGLLDYAGRVLLQLQPVFVADAGR
ncbi:MAG: TetR/AcrR family transcriptional regulator [Gammaproteobacteria bacterium]